MPKFSIYGNELLLVEEMKLLGVIVRIDMKWISNTKNIISKCYSRLWMLRNLKRYGADETQLKKVYIQQIRSILEMACPVWNAGLTQKEIRDLERIQKISLSIILGQGHVSYTESLEHFNIDPLTTRREKLCLNFIKKTLKNDKFKGWFNPNVNTVNTRSVKMPLLDVHTRTRRYEKSPLPYMTKLYNIHTHGQKQND